MNGRDGIAAAIQIPELLLRQIDQFTEVRGALIPHSNWLLEATVEKFVRQKRDHRSDRNGS